MLSRLLDAPYDYYLLLLLFRFFFQTEHLDFSNTTSKQIAFECKQSIQLDSSAARNEMKAIGDRRTVKCSLEMVLCMCADRIELSNYLSFSVNRSTNSQDSLISFKKEGEKKKD